MIWEPTTLDNMQEEYRKLRVAYDLLVQMWYGDGVCRGEQLSDETRLLMDRFFDDGP